jgi:hypothetical protein
VRTCARTRHDVAAVTGAARPGAQTRQRHARTSGEVRRGSSPTATTGGARRRAAAWRGAAAAEGSACREAVAGGERDGGGLGPVAEEEGAVYTRGIERGLTDGGVLRRPAGGGELGFGWEEVTRLNGRGEGRAGGRGVIPARGHAGHPAGVAGQRAGAGARGRRREGLTRGPGRAGRGSVRLTGGAGREKSPEKQSSSF